MRPPAECPVCGAAVPPKAKACPHCGADERTGWNEDETRYDDVDLPDSAFEDDNMPPRARSPRARLHPLWWLVGLGLLLLFAAGALLPGF